MSTRARCAAGCAWFALLVLLVAACSSKPAPAAADKSSTRALGNAQVTGSVGQYGSHQWLGLRFAKPPVGALRFRAPQLVAPEGKRAALAFGAPCPQLANRLVASDAEDGEPIGKEDCLFLNVYAPKLTPDQVASAKLPVMVWFHGGGNVIGHAGGYDGGNLAQRERVIVVTANYRLGPFGWFRHPALRAGMSPDEASGNFGVLDQVAALRFVQQHVAAFGGDPGNVTVFGESAGARDTMALLVAPQARGLFQRAIAQSGSVRVQEPGAAEAFAVDGGHKNSSNEVLMRLLVRDGKAQAEPALARSALNQMSAADVARYLRGVPADQLLAAYLGAGSSGMADVPNVFGDGAVLPQGSLLDPLARADGRAAVPVMLGTNRDESKTFMATDPVFVRRFTPFYVRMRDPERYAAHAEAMSRAWKVMGADAPAAAIAQSGGDAYVYRFDWDEEPTVLGNDISKLLGAGHGLEIAFVFGHWDLSPGANRFFTAATKDTRTALSQRMMGYWAEFARSGRPGKGRGAAGPEWPAYRPADGKPKFMVFDTEAGGGVRLDAGALGMDDVLAAIERDPRLRDPKHRCAVLAAVVRSSPLVDPSRLGTLADGACKDEPLSASR